MAMKQGYRRLGRCGWHGLILGDGIRHREADDQCTAAREHAPTVENDGNVHRAPPGMAGDNSAVSIR